VQQQVGLDLDAAAAGLVLGGLGGKPVAGELVEGLHFRLAG